MLAIRSASTTFHRQAAPALVRLSSTLAARAPNSSTPSKQLQQNHPTLSGVSRSFVDALNHEKNLLNCECNGVACCMEALELERKLVTLGGEKAVVKTCCAIEESVEEAVGEALLLEKKCLTSQPFQSA